MYGLQGGFRDFYGLEKKLHYGVQMESILTVFCCVVFLFHYSISSCLHVHGNVPKCYPHAVWVVLISLLCMKNKIHIGWNGISPTTIQDRQLKTRTGITVLFTFVSFSKNTRDLVQMLWMSFAYFMSLLPYNKVLLWWAEYWNEFYYILVMGRRLPCLLGNSVCCNAIVLLFLCKYLNKEKISLALRVLFVGYVMHAFTPLGHANICDIFSFVKTLKINVFFPQHW